ncbi:hypothetical protein ACFB49_31910 [Sphingomonas sp. DBB INV C78]|uniref:RidA family protein n=1 Tax=Sphingomonas sp. DBB INV C78 TaxID=3349434 RepID=UPI0036D3C60D
MKPFNVAAGIAIAAVTIATAATPAAAKRDPANVLMPEAADRRAVHEDYGFAEAVIHGDAVYLSGVVAGLRPGETDPSVAFDRAFRAIGEILKRAGSSWDDVVDMTTYHTDLPAQMESLRAVKARYVHAPYPAWTAIDVDRLAPEGGLVEIKVVAKRGK